MELTYKEFEGYKIYEDGRIMGKYLKFLKITNGKVSMNDTAYNIVSLIYEVYYGEK